MGAAPEGTPWDVYREIHKAMRFALASVTTMAVATEAAHADEVERLVAEWRDVKLVLLGHHGHEDDFCDVHVRAYASPLREQLEGAHGEAEAAIELRDAQTVDLLATPADQR